MAWVLIETLLYCSRLTSLITTPATFVREATVIYYYYMIVEMVMVTLTIITLITGIDNWIKLVILAVSLCWRESKVTEDLLGKSSKKCEKLKIIFNINVIKNSK